MKTEDSFLKYLQQIRMYVVCNFLLELSLGLSIVFIYSFIIDTPFSYIAYFVFVGCMLLKIFAYRQKLAFGAIAKEIDTMYPLGNVLYSAYYLIQYPKENIFRHEILFQANTQLHRLNLKEIQKKFYSFSFFIYTVLFFLGILLGFIGKNVDETTIVDKNKGIVKASSFKIEKAAEELDKLDTVKALQWKEIAKKWRNVDDTPLTPQQIQKDLDFVKNSIFPDQISTENNSISKNNTLAEIQELAKKWQNEILQDTDSLLQHLQKQLPEDTFAKIAKQLQSDSVAEAIEIYSDWQKEKEQIAITNIQNEISDLVDTLHDKLNLGSDNNLPTMEGNSNGGVSSFNSTTLPQTAIKLPTDTRENIVIRGWTKEFVPDQYKKIVQDYMREKEMYEEK